jgi:hypothetical protein
VTVRCVTLAAMGAASSRCAPSVVEASSNGVTFTPVAQLSTFACCTTASWTTRPRAAGDDPLRSFGS